MKPGSFTAERLLALYERVADGKDAIPRLRRFVLDLAVRGKLVEQDPSEETAAELLTRIAKERARLVKAGAIKKTKAIPFNHEAKAPTPKGWAFVPLGEIINYHLGGGTPSKNDPSYWGGDIRWASVKDVGKSKYVNDTIDRITQKGLENSSSNLIPAGNLIVVTRMGLGQLSINRVPLAINQDLRALFLTPFVDIDFVYNFFLTYRMEGTGLTVKGIKIEDLLGIPFLLPPLAEQRRIVARVEELMALCDQLEAARVEREAVRDRLTAATLARLTALEADGEAFAVHARFALETLPSITTRPDQIKALRQTILNLAVRGQLVEQDPTDESAADLLKRIQIQKLSVVDAKEQRRDSGIGGIDADQCPFSVPASWTWARLRKIVHNLGDGIHGTPSYDDGGDYYFINGNNLSSGKITIKVNTRKVSKHEFMKHRKPLNENSMLVSINGTLGNVAFYNGENVILGKSACYFEVSPLVQKEYLKILIEAPYFQDYAHSNATGTTIKNLSLNAMNLLPVPLPSLAEQHRIVEKVNSLMALCDQMETSLNTASATRLTLLEALLHESLVSHSGQYVAA